PPVQGQGEQAVVQDEVFSALRNGCGRRGGRRWRRNKRRCEAQEKAWGEQCPRDHGKLLVRWMAGGLGRSGEPFAPGATSYLTRAGRFGPGVWHARSRRQDGGTGSWLRTCSRVSRRVAALNGGRPVSPS